MNKKDKKSLRDQKIFIRISKEEFEEIKTNAGKFSRGNVSKWLRDRAKEPMLDVSVKMQNEKDGEF